MIFSYSFIKIRPLQITYKATHHKEKTRTSPTACTPWQNPFHIFNRHTGYRKKRLS